MTTDLYSSANYQDALQGYDHNDVQSLAHQTWTPENLCVESFHEQVKYYTSRWDGLCPYIDVTPQMLAAAKKPFIVYALPPEATTVCRSTINMAWCTPDHPTFGPMSAAPASSKN